MNATSVLARIADLPSGRAANAAATAITTTTATTRPRVRTGVSN